MSKLPCATNCLRILTIIFNFVVFLCGLVIVGFSSYLIYAVNKSFSDIDGAGYGVFIGFLVIGLIVCVLGFLGCCGAWKENVCMLTTFAVIIGLLLILDVVLIVLGFVYRVKLPDLLRDFLENELTDAKHGNTAVMDAIQNWLQCCGVYGPNDYDNAPIDSCGNFSDGCLVKAQDTFMGYATILLIVAIVVALLQLAAIIVACCLRSSIRSYQAV